MLFILNRKEQKLKILEHSPEKVDLRKKRSLKSIILPINLTIQKRKPTIRLALHGKRYIWVLFIKKVQKQPSMLFMSE